MKNIIIITIYSISLIKRDLKKILLTFQNNGIEVYITDGYINPKKIILTKTLSERLEKEEI